jgi:LDH2 family malate/lactate/ureidoglycolate dehydrogenase
MYKKGIKAPIGYVQDKNGISSDNPDILTQGGSILPLGGDYLHGSHKGYCMGAVVDIFSALLSGANFGPFVPPSVAYLPVLDKSPGIGTGHFFGAMRIDAFQTKDAFKTQMDNWIETFKSAKTIEGQYNVIIPGEPERKWEQIRMQEGIPVLDKVLSDLQHIAFEFNIEKL